MNTVPNNNPNISPEQINAMMKLASGKLGMSPEQLKAVLSDKKSTEDLMNKIGAGNQYKSAVNNPSSFEQMINNNPQAKKLLGDLFGGQKPNK
jgi:hypothetical protein